MNSLVTVIMPLYNIGECLRHSVKSVQEQTYKNLEIILIDDGSSDNTLAISYELAKNDDRVHVIHKENEGVSSARNIGIDNANGKYIAFVDGDDIVAPTYIESLIKAGNGKILTVCMHERITDYSFRFREPNNQHITLNAKECAYRLLKGAFPVGVWASLYSRDCIGSLRFLKSICNNEDKLFLYQYLLNNEESEVSFINDKLYGYYVREGSATRSEWNGSMDVILVADKMHELTLIKHPEWRQLADVNIIGARTSVLKLIVKAGLNTKKEKEAFESIKKEVLAADIPRCSSKVLRVEIKALRMSAFAFVLLVRAYYGIVNDKRRYKRNESVIEQKSTS